MAFFSDQLGMNKTVNRGVMLLEDNDKPEDALAAFDMHTSSSNGFFTSNMKGGMPPSLDWGNDQSTEDKLQEKPLGKALQLSDVATAASNQSTKESNQSAPIPVWLNTATTILSKVSVAKTLEAVQDAMMKMSAAKRVDFTLNSALMEIEATVASPARANCVIHVYNAKVPQQSYDGKEVSVLNIPSSAEVAVEFRRLSGCARAFYAFFNDILDSMDKSKFSRLESHAYSNFQFADLPNCVHINEDSGFDDGLVETIGGMVSFSDTVNTLVNMVKCEYDDAQKEALEALVAISKKDASKAELGQKLQDERGVLGRLLSSPDAEIVALTECILSNIEFLK